MANHQKTAEQRVSESVKLLEDWLRRQLKLPYADAEMPDEGP